VRDEAAPKGISRRTSYLRVRLAFHSYPQVIPTSCDMLWFGPPDAFRRPSPCSWVAHPVSGLVPATDNALFGLAFAPAAAETALAKPLTTNSLAHYAKGTPSRPASRCECKTENEKWKMEEIRHFQFSIFNFQFASRSEALRLLVRITFQRLFHPPFGVLFTFPSRYYPLLISVPV